MVFQRENICTPLPQFFYNKNSLIVTNESSIWVHFSYHFSGGGEEAPEVTSPEVTWTGNDVIVTWTGSDVTVTWTGNDITGSDVTGNGPEVGHCFPCFLIFREFSGMFVTVRDVFGVMVRGRSPCMRGGFLRMRERKRAIFSRAFWFFGVFRSVLWMFEMSLMFWR